MASPRLRYRPLDETDLEALHAIVTEAHVKRYLFDGETMTHEWCANAIAISRRTFADDGVGLWLTYPAGNDEPVGLCGFWAFQELGPELQLLYAFTEPNIGRGYATEAAMALVTAARAAGMTEIVSAVDEPNTASIRILEKLGFERTGSVPGAFGHIVTFVLQLR